MQRNTARAQMEEATQEQLRPVRLKLWLEDPDHDWTPETIKKAVEWEIKIKNSTLRRSKRLAKKPAICYKED